MKNALAGFLLIAAMVGAGALLARGRRAAARAAAAPPELAFLNRPVIEIDPGYPASSDLQHWATAKGVFVGPAPLNAVAREIR